MVVFYGMGLLTSRLTLFVCVDLGPAIALGEVQAEFWFPHLTSNFSGTVVFVLRQLNSDQCHGLQCMHD